jgi:hypothetical protein
VGKAIRKASLVHAALLMFAFIVPAIGANFKVLDGITGYKPEPISSPDKLEIIYSDSLWGPKPTENAGLPWPPKDLSPADEKRIQDLAKTWVEKKIPLVCLDFEDWPVQGDDATIRESIGKFKKVLDLIREAAPDVKVGIYGTLPVRDVYRAIKDPSSQAYQDWQVENERLKPLAQLVDVIFPSLYTMTTDPQIWKAFALSNLRQAKLYGKPVYAFIWPRYHDSIKLLAWTFLPKAYWEMELQTVKEQADGAVIWDFGKWKPWDEQAVWWQSTLSILGK